MFEKSEFALPILQVSSASEELDALSERILSRDRTLQEGARTYWFQNGRDLLQAKTLAGHGNFEAWCKNKLSYSKSKAEKLMRATEMFGPVIESITVTDLPPPTLFYTLSAPSVPQVIRDEYLPRVLAKEKGVASELKKAIQRYRKDLKRAEGYLVESPEAPVEREAVGEQDEAQIAEQCQAKQQRQAAARAAALALILARLGDDLPMLLTLVAEAEVQDVFSYETVNELQERARDLARFSEASLVMDVPETAHAQAFNTPTDNDIGKSRPNLLSKAVDEERGPAPPPIEPNLCSTSAAAGIVPPPPNNITIRRAKHPTIFHSRGRLLPS